MKQHTFKLSDSGKEFPVRFGKQEVTYDYPADMAELRDLAEKAAATHTPKEGEDKATADTILYGMATGQGYHLNRQKAIKDELANDEANKDLTVEQAIARAVKETAAPEVGCPVPGTRRGEGKGTKLARAEAGRVKAEQKADAALDAALLAYKQLPKNLRAQYGATLVERGLATQEQLDEAVA